MSYRRESREPVALLELAVVRPTLTRRVSPKKYSRASSLVERQPCRVARFAAERAGELPSWDTGPQRRISVETSSISPADEVLGGDRTGDGRVGLEECGVAAERRVPAVGARERERSRGLVVLEPRGCSWAVEGAEAEVAKRRANAAIRGKFPGEFEIAWTFSSDGFLTKNV